MSDETLIVMVRKPATAEHPREHFFFTCDRTAEAISELIGHVQRFAGNPELRFNWYDAALVNGDLRREYRELKGKP